ncbi:hypothetical protein [Granulicella sp. dw_53]|uniref:hypothetical protein n=1 Tax=Granulicella sp. dw_53 TaxID=2719792 RepID=UPI001BD5A987|nr:hypothetical protein [Granulicella sp. dw_53]
MILAKKDQAMIAESEELRLKAQEELSRILKSPAFHGSPRCKQFLQFVVDRALDGQYDVLKERMIGIEVFGRNPAYQTDGDSVVRVRASDVRRRLVQYYSVAEAVPACRIEIPSGSYIPHFLPPERSTPSLPPASFGIAEKSGKITPTCGNGIADLERRFPMAKLTLAAGFLILVLLMAFFGHRRLNPSVRTSEPATETPFQAFWAPAVRSSKPVLICIGSPVAYNYSKSFRTAYTHRRGLSPEEARNAIIEPAETPLKGSDLIPVKNEFVGAGDANAASLLSALFGSLGKTTEFRISTETSYSELSDSPSVLIGAFSNRWTERTLMRMPYVFVERDSVRFVQEQTGSKRSWTLPQLGADGKTDEDFAIVSRVLDAETGQFLVTAAGISSFGSRAAGYFLTRPDQMNKELGKAPKEWKQKNLQFVLKTHVVDGAPTAPEVVAVTFW